MSKNTPNDTDAPIDDRLSPPADGSGIASAAAADVNETEAGAATESHLPALHHSLAEDLAKHPQRGLYRRWFLDCA